LRGHADRRRLGAAVLSGFGGRPSAGGWRYGSGTFAV
jgi:hypothetical protein